jgi:hypothetical protein
MDNQWITIGLPPGSVQHPDYHLKAQHLSREMASSSERP